MIKVREALGTRYLTVDYEVGFRKLLNDASKSGEEVDLAKCKLTPGCETILRQFYGAVVVCNTEEPELDAILKSNAKAKNADGLKSTPIPVNLSTEEAVLTFLRGVSSSDCFNISNCMLNPVRTIALAILITLRNPEVVIDLGPDAKSLFNQVRLDWMKYRSKHEEYLEVVGNAIVTRKVVNGKVYVPGFGTFDEYQYVTDFTVLPACFGRDRLNLSAEFKGVWQSAVNNLLFATEALKTMKDYIEVGEV